MAHVSARAPAGLEEVDDGAVRRAVLLGPSRLPRVLTLRFAVPSAPGDAFSGTVDVDVDVGLVGAAEPGVRTWLGMDIDGAAGAAHLARDVLLAPLVERRPGLSIPGTVDGGELALRTVLGQQVSVAAARTLTGRLVTLLGADCGSGLYRFPEPAAIAAAGVGPLRAIGLTGSRAAAVVQLARAIDEGLDLAPGADRATARAELGALPGIGSWTVEYVALRALRDHDAFPAHDLVLRQALGGVDAREATRRAEAWRPWRGYAAQHLWRAASLGQGSGRGSGWTRPDARR